MPEPEGSFSRTDAPVVLEAVELVKHFRARGPGRGRAAGGRPRVRAVENVSLQLSRGRVTALVGESGSGKSTVARLLAQLYPPTSGEIRLDGRQVRVRSSRGLRRYASTVQMVLQDPFSSLNPVHTVHYHLARSLRIHRRVDDSGLDASVNSLLERVNLTPADRIGRRFPHELSGGQRQRVSIARAIAAQPRILLADEPVSMLDVSIRLEMLNLLGRLKDEDKLAVLYITHDIASARYFADDILVMYAGQLIEGGPAERLTQHPAHPYTQMLIAAAPDPDRVADKAIGDVVGEPPSLIHPPTGCRFRPRCELAMPICAERFPDSTDQGDGQWARCWATEDASAR